MSTIYFDSPYTDEERRQRLYDGQLFVYSACPGAMSLCALAREMSEEAFAPLDPRDAQHSLPVEEYAAILAKLKPAFIHHPRAKQYIQGMLQDLGCDLDKVYLDVPRLRTMTHGDYFKVGLAYAFHPHRDTWYSAPFSQINWWLPVYDIEANSALAFHPRYWSQPVRNGSSSYNYYEWNATSRKIAAQQIKTDTRIQPHPEEPLELEPQVRVVSQVGGVTLFSGAQLHSTVPNTSGRTRFSIDFRTVHIDDVVAKRGALNIDSACTGTTLRDFLRGSDFVRLAEEIALLYDDEPPTHGELIFQAPSMDQPTR
jgi:phytanoyl-CoA dioxygenase PhyH